MPIIACQSKANKDLDESYINLFLLISQWSEDGLRSVSWNRKQESRMEVAKRQGREKPEKMEQKKVRGPE